ncbi:unnamed protein product [Prorocentrum cordatum]|uniref:Uncharacterized protein n=1 Tax=Prorocentrum cordatum TaxID=2364126 RepID=A0ABN9VAG2_9DINO|nr:unnamed protein product [Polarella glacialis]
MAPAALTPVAPARDMPRDAAAGRCEAPDPERSQLLAPAASRAPAAAWSACARRAPTVAMAALLVAVAAASACRSAWAQQRPGGARGATAAQEVTGLAEERHGLQAPGPLSRERLEKMSTKELFELAKKLQEEVSEFDDGMGPPLEEDPNSTHQHTQLSASARCSASHEDCRSTKCCSDAGLQCYEKSEWWAMCRARCIPGVADPADVDPEHWSCRKFGERSKGRPVEPGECHGVHDNCMGSKCCKDPGFACFAKNGTFGRCMPECAPGPQYFDLDDGDPWSCRQVGAAALSTVGKWTEANCTGDADDCRESKCCATSGLQCYEVDGEAAQCRPSCLREDGSPCTELGYRTPPPPAELPDGPLGGKVGWWVEGSCSKDGEDCSGTLCCVGAGMQCYQKDSKHAACAGECQANSTWTCKELGTRSWGPA